MFDEVVERNHGGRGREGRVVSPLNAAELRHDLTNHEDLYLISNHNVDLCFGFNHYSHATYLDHGEIIYSPFPVRCPRGGGTLRAPLCPPAQAFPKKM